MKFCFVIPLVHPDGERVTDYGAIEQLLHMTLTSLLAQSVTETAIVVVCHRVPDWHDTLPDRVTFLQVPDDDRFPINHVQRHIDKAIKLAAGAHYTLQQHAPDYVMFVDGDDTVHVNLAKTVLERKLPRGADGYSISRGMNARIKTMPDAIELQNAYFVKHFNRDCGSCRILSASALRRTLSEVAPNASAVTMALTADGYLSQAYIDAIYKDAEVAFPVPKAPFRIFGNHIQQDMIFSLATLDLPLASKTCGHENHVGPRKDTIHWHRVTGKMSLKTFMANFGLADAPFLVANEAPVSPLKLLVKPHTERIIVGTRSASLKTRKSLKWLTTR
ncbi:MAG: glycosyltransferase family A protein [Pseudomonadota bacterium]